MKNNLIIAVFLAAALAIAGLTWAKMKSESLRKPSCQPRQAVLAAEKKKVLLAKAPQTTKTTPSGETLKAKEVTPTEKPKIKAQSPAPKIKVRQPSCEKTAPKCLDSMDFLSGYGWGKLNAKRNYNLVPFMVDFNFDLKPLTRKIHFDPPQMLQFAIEPFACLISSPNTNAEIGTSFLLKVGLLPQSWKFQPYFVGGAGMVYVSQHFREQGTQFNFVEYGGLGLRYFFKKNTALTLEGRFRHLSNCSMSSPNHGINTYFVVSGVTYQF
jgi:hypothetical protein